MKISQLKKSLKEIKEIVKYEDGKTEIEVTSPVYTSLNMIRLQTKIGDYAIVIQKDFSEKKQNIRR